MKKLLFIILVMAMISILCGCVRYNVEIQTPEIKLDKESNKEPNEGLTNAYQEEFNKAISESINEINNAISEGVSEFESTVNEINNDLNDISKATNNSDIKKETTYQFKEVENFSIEGKWKNVGDTTFGQAQKGAIIVFDGKNCNYFSPMDTYAFYKEGNNYVLDCTSLLAQTLSFKVDIKDEDNIVINYGSTGVELKRVK